MPLEKQVLPTSLGSSGAACLRAPNGCWAHHINCLYSWRHPMKLYYSYTDEETEAPQSKVTWLLSGGPRILVQGLSESKLQPFPLCHAEPWAPHPAWCLSHALALPVSQDLWSSLSPLSIMAFHSYLTAREMNNQGQEAKCFKLLNCLDTSPNGSPVLIILFEVQSASILNGINFPFNNSSYKPQT